MRSERLRALTAAALAVAMVAAVVPAVSADGTVHHVEPGESIQDAVDAAKPGDTIRLSAGTFHQKVVVPEDTEDLVIEGAGQGETILDGNGGNGTGIAIYADGVSVRDLTVRAFSGDGVLWYDVTGFYADRVSVVDNGAYGLYALKSRVGWFRDSFGTGQGDSAFYIGETLDCQCVLERLVARGNLIGYSGTAANMVTIRDSLFEDNAAGIVPNVLPTENAPQTHTFMVDNVVRDNENRTMSERHHFVDRFHVPHGLGIVVAGGSANLVQDNVVTGHSKAGVAMTWLFTEPSLNEVRDNLVRNDGPDILWDGGGANNCFEGNHRPDGSPATFDAGLVWNTAGTLPDCDTPNAGPPDPGQLGRLVSLVVFGCEPEDQPGPPCHTDHEE